MTDRPTDTGHQSSPLKDVDQHLRDVSTLLAPRTPTRVGLAEALGCVLAEDVFTQHALPAFATSAMDGYAVRVADLPGRLVVIGEVRAGSTPDMVIGPGEAARIMTGGLLPDGTEAVIPVEDTDGRTDIVTINRSIDAGAFLRPAGSDLAAGRLVLARGSRLLGAQIAALAAVGRQRPLVLPRPRVAILSTGEEVVAMDAARGPAQLIDSNRPGLIAAATWAGASVVDGGIVGDDVDAFLAVLDNLNQEADLVITTGGVSMGAHDVVKLALREVPTMHFDRVAMQPGMPQAWGLQRDGTPLLGLPGNPVSALVSFELFGRATLGCPRPIRSMTLGSSLMGSPKGKRQFVPCHCNDDEVVPVGGTASHLLSVLARATGLIVVPEQTEQLAEGAVVDVVDLG